VDPTAPLRQARRTAGDRVRLTTDGRSTVRALNREPVRVRFCDPRGIGGAPLGLGAMLGRRSFGAQGRQLQSAALLGMRRLASRQQPQFVFQRIDFAARIRRRRNC
jgi:hypothetical protein